MKRGNDFMMKEVRGIIETTTKIPFFLFFFFPEVAFTVPVPDDLVIWFKVELPL